MNVCKNVYIISSPIFIVALTGWLAAAKPQADPPYTASIAGDATGIVFNMAAYRPQGKDRLLVELEGPGTLYFPFNGVLGDGVNDLGDVLMVLNTVDSDGDGDGDLFDNAAIDENASVICISGTIKIGAADEVDALGLPLGAGISLTWTGTEHRKASSYRIFVGAFRNSSVPKNWWVCPDRESWPDTAWLLLGVDPLAGSNNCTTPVVIGQVFRVKRLAKGGTTIWSYGQAGTSAFVDIVTVPE